jgi:hypothetical protein
MRSRRVLSRGRLAVVAGCVLVLALGSGAVAGAAPIPQAKTTLAVRALTVSPASVDARAGGASVTVDWTITNSDRKAVWLAGDLHLRLKGPGKDDYLGYDRDVQFAYQVSLGQASYVSGTPQDSSYTYTFPVPSYAGKRNAKWVVTEIDATDGKKTLTATGAALSGFARGVTATEQVDRTAPIYQIAQLAGDPGAQPDVYDNGVAGTVEYSLDPQDLQSGFWKGQLTVTGPGGLQLRAPFDYHLDQGNGRCGDSGSSDEDAFCTVAVTVPADSPAGTYSLTDITLTDNAGNTHDYSGLDLLPVVVTGNRVLRATGFSATPNPVNNWTQTQTVQLSLTPVGAQQGVSAVYADASSAGGNCAQLSTTPTVGPDGSVSVPLRFDQGTRSCPVEGIAVVDGAGNVALYGSDYGAPDPEVTITQIPDTTPPSVTAASLTRTSVPAGSTGFANVFVNATTVAPVAPVDEFSTTVYDGQGNVATGGNGQPAVESGGIMAGPGGVAQLGVNLPSGLAPGTYAVAFQVTDAGHLSSPVYGGPTGQPVPGGPLTITVTAS